MTDMTVQQALGELNGLVRLFKALSKAEETLKVVAEIEQRKDRLSKEVNELTKETTEYDQLLNQADDKLQHALKAIEESEKKADRILENAKIEALQIKAHAEKFASDLRSQVRDEVKATEEQIINLRKEVDSLKNDVKQAFDEKQKALDKLAQEKQRIFDLFK